MTAYRTFRRFNGFYTSSTSSKMIMVPPTLRRCDPNRHHLPATAQRWCRVDHFVESIRGDFLGRRRTF